MLLHSRGKDYSVKSVITTAVRSPSEVHGEQSNYRRSSAEHLALAGGQISLISHMSGAILVGPLAL